MEVGIDGHVAEVVVPLAQVQGSAEDGCLAAGVYRPVGVDSGGGAVGLAVGDAGYSVAFEYGAGDGALLKGADAVGAGVVEQYLVEGWTPDLVGVGPGSVGFDEAPAPGFGVAAPEHGGAVFLGEAGGFDPLQDA